MYSEGTMIVVRKMGSSMWSRRLASGISLGFSKRMSVPSVSRAT